jgi:hypothetical protein
MDILRQYSEQAAAAHEQDGASNDFGTVARTAPPDAEKEGLAKAFRAEETPPFAQMVAKLFARSNTQQRAGLLALFARTVGSDALASVLSHIPGGFAGTPQVTEKDAEKVTPQHVERIAAEAEKRNPQIVDQVSEFYAQHPDVVKTLEGAALGIALSSIARRVQR